MGTIKNKDVSLLPKIRIENTQHFELTPFGFPRILFSVNHALSWLLSFPTKLLSAFNYFQHNHDIVFVLADTLNLRKKKNKRPVPVYLNVQQLLMKKKKKQTSCPSVFKSSTVSHEKKKKRIQN